MRKKRTTKRREAIAKRPWTSFTSNRQGLKTTYFSQSCAHSCQCPRTDTQIGRGECFRETAKTAEDGSSYGKDGSGQRESGPHRFYFLYFPQPFCKKTYFLYFPHPFCKKAQLIKSRVIVNSRVVIYGANELPICKKPKFWPPNVKGLIFRSPLVKRKAFN